MHVSVQSTASTAVNPCLLTTPCVQTALHHNMLNKNESRLLYVHKLIFHNDLINV